MEINIINSLSGSAYVELCKYVIRIIKWIGDLLD